MKDKPYREMIRDKILRPLAESWGIEGFDELNVEIHFQPSVRRLTMEDIQKLPVDSVSPNEKREILKTLHIPLDDSEFEAVLDRWSQFARQKGEGIEDSNKFKSFA